MSEEPLAPGSVSLEEGTTITGPDPQTPPAPEPDEAPPVGTIEGSGGVKFAPLEAVISERTQRKEATKERDTLKAENEQLKAKAAQFDQLRGYVDQSRPIIEALRARPDLLAEARKPQEPPKVLALSADDAEAYAKDLDLYKPDGTPDVDRAQRLAARQAALAERSARQVMQPLHQQTATQQAHANRASLLTIKDAAGQTVDQAALDQMFGVVPAELAARPEVAQVLYLAAKGLQMHTKGAPAKLAPPLLTEAAGGGKTTAGDLTAVEEHFQRAAGIGKSEFQKTAAKYQPGKINSLE